MSWVDHGRCVVDFGPVFDRLPEADQIVTCYHCTVRDECLQDALVVERKLPGHPQGVRGGMTGRTRSKIIRAERKKAADRKVAAA